MDKSVPGEMGTKARTHVDAASFLRSTQGELESHEPASGLILGVCLRLARSKEAVRTPPYLKTVEREQGLVLAAMMTPPHKLVVFGLQGNLDAGAQILVEDLAGGGWKVPGVLGPKEHVRRVADRWTAITGQRHQVRRRQRLYAMREVETQSPARGRLRLAEAADTRLVAGWRYAFHYDVGGEADREDVRRTAEHRIEKGDIYLWEDEGPVSMAMKTRPTTNGISVGMVYTPPAMRRRGYATACVGELSRLLLESGWGYCALFANVANAAAIRVYRRIGYQPVCDYDEFVFLGDE